MSPHVGLALGYGGARGYAHAGVLHVLEREGIPIQSIAGTSMGAVMGVAYAQRGEAAFARYVSERFQSAYYRRTLRITWRGLGIDTALLERFFEETYPCARLEDCAVPARVVVTDMVSRVPLSLGRGPLPSLLTGAVLSPLLNAPARAGDLRIVDGGLMTDIPFRAAAEMGADALIGVRCSGPSPSVPPRPPSFFPLLLPPFLFGRRHPYLSAFQVVHRALVRQAEERDLSALRIPAFVIEPDFQGLEEGDYPRAPEIIRRGEEAAERALPALRAFLQRVEERRNAAQAAAAGALGEPRVPCLSAALTAR